jgi:hypothetical protein
MLCDIKVQDAPTIVTSDEKAIEHAEGDRRNCEEVHRGNRFPVITDGGYDIDFKGGQSFGEPLELIQVGGLHHRYERRAA